MAVKKITEYRLGWEFDRNLGVVSLRDEAGTWIAHKEMQDASAFSAVVDILRNEEPVYYNDQADLITTFREPVGEGESS